MVPPVLDPIFRNSTLVSLVLLIAVAPAAAQPPQHTERAVEGSQDNPDLTRGTVSAGATLATGNTRNFAVVGSAGLELRRDANVFVAEIRGQYGQSSVRDPMGTFGAYQTNAENIQGRARYDRFFTASDAVFGAVLGRRDRFAGLDLRLQLQVGYLREIFDLEESKHRFWFEVGYDLTYDNFDPDPLVDPMMPLVVLEGTDVVHSGRAFIGYVNRLNDALTYETGVEVLVNVQDPSDTRVNWRNQVRTTVSRGLLVSLDFELRWDHEPVQGAEPLDTLTTLNVVLTIESPDPDAAAS
jgi:putative salt-induced outer membrane protein YdiY